MSANLLLSAETSPEYQASRGAVVLLVDDEQQVLDGLCRQLAREPFHLKTATSGVEAMKIASEETVDLIVSDEKMPGVLGTKLLAWFSEEHPEIIRILLTGYKDFEASIRAINEGHIYRYFNKPVHTDELSVAIQQGLLQKRLQEGNRLLYEQTLRQMESLQLANQKLECSNQRLDQFAKVVAHDLNDPLGTMINFCDLAKECFSESADSSGSEFLDCAIEAGLRMNRLIKQLLAYAAAENSEIVCSQVSLNDVVDCARENLHAKIAETETTFFVDPLPTIWGEKTLLIQLFQNLFSNAINYRADCPPILRVASASKDGGWEISVEDNGIGIREENFQRIFEAFERVERSRHGTGLGLATCRRIMERHGGRISLNSSLGVGTTFVLDFPNARDDN